MTAIGYIPKQNPIKDLLSKVLGYPHILRRLQAPLMLQYLDLRPAMTVVDVGCGCGWFTYTVARIARVTAIGVDVSSWPTWHAPSSAKKLCYFTLGNATQPPIKHRVADRVVLSSVLQMVSDPQRLMDEVARILKPQGVVVITIPLGPRWQFLAGKAPRGSDPAARLAWANNIITAAGLKITAQEFSPKAWGSLIYELWFFVARYFTTRPKFVYAFPLYPLMLIDRLLPKSSKGDEVVIRAEKRANRP